MKLADTNVWLAIALSKHVFHDAAQAWLAAEAAPHGIAFCRATQPSLLRLLTTSAVMIPYGNRPLTNTQAWDLYEQFLADPRITRADEPTGLDSHWESLAKRDTASPKVWMDAYLAAFAIAVGHQLVTTDGDFRQFPDLDCYVIVNG